MSSGGGRQRNDVFLISWAKCKHQIITICCCLNNKKVIYTYYIYIGIHTFSSYNYFWLFSWSGFALSPVASNGCPAACGNVCSAAGVLADLQTYIAEKLLFASSCRWNTNSGTRRVFFFVIALFLRSCLGSWCRAGSYGQANRARELDPSQTWLLRFSGGWKQNRFAASLRKVLQRHPSAAVCVRERKAFV